MNPTDLMLAAGPLLADGFSPDSSSDRNLNILVLLAAGPVAGVLTYLSIYRYYRNTDKRHHFETETRVRSSGLRVIDNRVDAIRRTHRRYTEGRNDGDHLERVQRVDLGDQPGDPGWVARHAAELRAQQEAAQQRAPQQPPSAPPRP